MRHSNLLLPLLSAVSLLCATSTGRADALSDQWQALEKSFEGTAPPTMASDCDKYTVDSAKAECMDYVNKKPTFTFRAVGNQQTGADTAAIRYCTRIGKTYQFKGRSAVDPTLYNYECK
jgi:hypothetical protein